MIKTKKELNKVLEIEKSLYFSTSKKYIECRIVQDKDWFIFKFQKFLRKSEYHFNNKNNSFIHKLFYAYYRRRKNILGTKLGIEIWENSVDEGLRIWHAGSIVINGYAKAGKGLQLRGENCIGNSNKSDDTPVIGDNVSLGNGSKIIGPVTIADNVQIGAGAVVVKSCTEEGAVLVGVPAKILKMKE